MNLRSGSVGAVRAGILIAALCTAASLFTAACLWLPHSAAAATSQGEKLVKGSDCLSCHAIDHKVVGPAFVDVAKRYAGKSGAVAQLVAKVRKGGSGNWGSVAMTPHPSLSDADLTKMVKWILSLKGGSPKSTSESASQFGGKKFTYTSAGGKTVVLDFPIYIHGEVVTNNVFSGWEKFDAYCYRCHGTDAEGGLYAPNLRESLEKGMTREDFINTALAGRIPKGMPSWAGFFSREELEQIYEYTKARSVGVLPAGRPQSSHG